MKSVAMCCLTALTLSACNMPSATAATAATGAPAGASSSGLSTYTCASYGGIEEDVVAIDLSKGKASYFDNDSWYDAVQDSAPQHEVYTFRGTYYSQPMVITFDRLAGTSQLALGDETFAAERGCAAGPLVNEL